MNISSLQYHVDDLRYLVESCPNKPKVIGITECRLRKNKEVLSNIYSYRIHKRGDPDIY